MSVRRRVCRLQAARKGTGPVEGFEGREVCFYEKQKQIEEGTRGDNDARMHCVHRYVGMCVVMFQSKHAIL